LKISASPKMLLLSRIVIVCVLFAIRSDSKKKIDIIGRKRIFDFIV